MCSSDSTGKARCSTGTSTPNSKNATATTVSSRSVLSLTSMFMAAPSTFDRAALEREDALRSLLDEQNDHAQHDDLAEHSARDRLEQLVDDAETKGTNDRAGELS